MRDAVKLTKAQEIATSAHAGQLDRGGAPYIGHVERVAAWVDSDDAKAVAWLHDVVEDTPWTIAMLEREGFSPAVLAAVDAITKRDGETYTGYLLRVMANPIALEVKLSDLVDNMNLHRLSHVTKRDRERHQKYQEARNLLLSYLALQNRPGALLSTADARAPSVEEGKHGR